MGRPYRRGPVRPERPEHRINHRIRFPKVRVIAADGEALGVMSPDEGRAQAQDQGLDLVEVAPNARPPVCKIMDYGKFKYERAKKTTNKRTTPTVKTVQVRPKTSDHDLHTKLKNARRFLERGDKVRVVMRLRGRERAHIDLATQILRDSIKEGIGELGVVRQPPAYQGRMITALVEPSQRHDN